MIYLQRLLAVAVFLALGSMAAGQALLIGKVPPNTWDRWLASTATPSTPAISRNKFEELLIETAEHLNIKGEVLVESLVTSFSKVKDTPNPVALLFQLRQELQRERGFSGSLKRPSVGVAG